MNVLTRLNFLINLFLQCFLVCFLSIFSPYFVSPCLWEREILSQLNKSNFQVLQADEIEHACSTEKKKENLTKPQNHKENHHPHT